MPGFIIGPWNLTLGLNMAFKVCIRIGRFSYFLKERKVKMLSLDFFIFFSSTLFQYEIGFRFLAVCFEGWWSADINRLSLSPGTQGWWRSVMRDCPEVRAVLLLLTCSAYLSSSSIHTRQEWGDQSPSFLPCAALAFTSCHVSSQLCFKKGAGVTLRRGFSVAEGDALRRALSSTSGVRVFIMVSFKQIHLGYALISGVTTGELSVWKSAPVLIYLCRPACRPGAQLPYHICFLSLLCRWG